MKIYFNPVPQADVDHFGEDGLFETESGNFFYNYVEYGTNPGGTEEFTIHDGCGRYIPLTVESIAELVEVLERVQRMHSAIQHGEDTLDMVMSDAQVKIED